MGSVIKGTRLRQGESYVKLYSMPSIRSQTDRPGPPPKRATPLNLTGYLLLGKTATHILVSQPTGFVCLLLIGEFHRPADVLFKITPYQEPLQTVLSGKA